MKYIARLIFAVLLSATPFLPTAALAHSDHNEPLSEMQVLERAERHVHNMAVDPDYLPELQLEGEWNGELTSSVAKKSARALILTVTNQQANRTVYLHMDYYGGLYSANFSGDFEGWK
jgi:hypothetical protein